MVSTAKSFHRNKVLLDSYIKTSIIPKNSIILREKGMSVFHQDLLICFQIQLS